VAAEIIRSPDSCFVGLPEFDFRPHYVQLEDARYGALRMHYLDEGQRDAPVALMLHGEPTWSFLYRKIIPRVVAAGFRAIAPDYIGFGRSDIFTSRARYTYQNHVGWMAQFVDRLDMKSATLVLQDWGGPIGLRLLVERPHRFNAVLVGNTVLPNCEPPPNGIEDWPGPLITPWAASTEGKTDFDIGSIIRQVFFRPPAPEVVAAYEAPYPDARYKAGILEFPSMIPVTADRPGIEENRRAWKFLERFDKPFLTAFSASDPGTTPWEPVFQRRVPGARGQPHIVIPECGHFIQEEGSEALSAALVGLMRRQDKRPE
jgi:haloalkane dehalogenase